ncbi:deaminase [Intrasporangium oryzae NRRL B-24470]|uniref:Deaminase n=1 Tax=Intrasporangium oryzae NRRL B-24470 TaxID=1386089 RepID=W9GBF3_9MICO|nr:dihydrofolate reductase family protein [Intrasporangium oryzae]EWT02158.1 deaminase [Intrasporangium oryzae NRRL B-24470]
MGRVRLHLTISLDGLAAGPGTSDEHPLGIRGERLHEWMGEDHEANRRASEATFEGAGAVVLGRRMLGVGLPLWDPDTFELLPVFVPTHRAGEPVVVEGGSTFTLVTGDCDDETIRQAVGQAQVVAGERDVVILGGATTARAALAADLVDEIRLAVAHTLLGEGERLFDGQDGRLSQFRVTESAEAPGVTHVVLVRE